MGIVYNFSGNSTERRKALSKIKMGREMSVSKLFVRISK